MTKDKKHTKILVTGATGYVGGRLAPMLAARGYRVRAMGRSLDKLNCRPWAHHPNVETVQGDVLDLAAFSRAVEGYDAAFYLVHSMIASDKGFADDDRTGAILPSFTGPRLPIMNIWSRATCGL